MSEKQFEFYSDDYLIGVLDNVTGKTLNHFATIDLLNEQQAIITELNKQIEQLHLAIDDLLSHTSCDEIKKENEQLKKEYKIAIDEMVTDYKKLEKENEQLRKQLDFYLLDEFEWKEKYGDCDE